MISTHAIDVTALKILVVEDNPHFRNLQRAILETLGVTRIEEASGGDEALDTLRRFDADLAILDWKMAGIDGIECVRRIRNDPDSPNRFLPVVMVSGYLEENLARDAAAAGVNEFLAKPISARSLLSRMVSAIESIRPFVESGTYFGPDRRHKPEAEHQPERRLEQRGLLPIPGVLESGT
jgi:two-component system chemotaxis response regulator CheY